MQGPSLPISTLVPVRHGLDLLSALETYDATSVRLVESWFDVHVASAFSRQIDAIRERAVATPGFTVLALQLVIAHHELASTLWQQSSVGVSAAQLLEVRERHTLALAALRAALASGAIAPGPDSRLPQ